MPSSMQFRREHREWQGKYDPQAPKVGDMAPDFLLHDVNGENPVRLSDYRNRKPVALIFGSYT